jgi:hypothetical protein
MYLAYSSCGGARRRFFFFVRGFGLSSAIVDRLG